LDEDDEVVEEETEQPEDADEDEDDGEDVEALQEALAEQKEKAERYLGSWQRCQADLENYTKRAEQARSETVAFANMALLMELLPILDDFERALTSVPTELDEQNWIRGIRLIYDKLKTALQAQGLAEIKAEGEPFDPYVHEAAGQMDGEEGIVMEEIRKGYKFRDKLLRPSMVMVGTGNKNNTEEENLEEG
jgi:molecular chaperone GrpE